MTLKSPLSKQTTGIYSLLLRNGALNAKEIGKELRIVPQAVYRSIHTLLSLGCIYRVNGQYPDRFEAKPVRESVETFSILQREWFLKSFREKLEKKDNDVRNHLTMSFIENRSVMFEKCLIDMRQTKEEINLLISGDPPPADVMLEEKRLLENGVVIRMLVQKNDKWNKQVLESYKRMGMEVRVRESVQARIVVMDHRVVYFMSYDPDDKDKSIGIRFEYPPMGQLMDTLFMHYWDQAKTI